VLPPVTTVQNGGKAASLLDFSTAAVGENTFLGGRKHVLVVGENTFLGGRKHVFWWAIPRFHRALASLADAVGENT
jgi:hypothetical protein